jgi:hypothetical protein
MSTLASTIPAIRDRVEWMFTLAVEAANGKAIPPGELKQMGETAAAIQVALEDVEVFLGTPVAADVAPRWVSLADIITNPPPPRRWVVDQWLPHGSLALLSGRGGTGKSLLLQQLATCIAGGTEFFGTKTTSGRVIALLTEDDGDEVRRRQGDICRALGIDPSRLEGNLFIEGRAGRDNVLMVPTQSGEMAPTELFDALRKSVSDLRPRLLALDNVGQIFAGNENIRSLVTQFCNKLTGLAVDFDCTVLLLGHTAKGEGSEYSGSTAWEAAVRTRLWLERKDDGTTELRRRKANYASIDEALKITWRQGAFVLDDGSDDTAPLVIADARGALLKALDTLTERRVPTSHLATARNYLPRVARAEGLLGTVAVQVAPRALATLLDDGTLTPHADLGWKRSDRHPAVGLVRSHP